MTEDEKGDITFPSKVCLCVYVCVWVGGWVGGTHIHCPYTSLAEVLKAYMWTDLVPVRLASVMSGGD